MSREEESRWVSFNYNTRARGDKGEREGGGEVLWRANVHYYGSLGGVQNHEESVVLCLLPI